MKMNPKLSTESVRLQILREILTTNKESIFSVEHSNAIITAGVATFDDCAVVDINNTTSLLIGTDFIRGTGFDMFELGIMDFYDVGYYLIIANLSDVASMGAQPIGITTVVRYPKDMTDDQFRDIFRGMKDASDKYNVPIIGGDIGGYQLAVVAATAFGITDRGKYLLRNGVQQGDILCVTGNIGIPRTAVAYFKHAHNRGFTLASDLEDLLRASWKRPSAQVQAGLLLSQSGLGHACQDISDGFKTTIDQLSAASGQYFMIEETALPIHDCTRKVASFLGVDSTHLAVSNSVDFQLCFTISEESLSACKQLFEEHGISFTVVGRTAEVSYNCLRCRNGDVVPLPGVTWDHTWDDITSEIISDGKI